MVTVIAAVKVITVMMHVPETIVTKKTDPGTWNEGGMIVIMKIAGGMTMGEMTDRIETATGIMWMTGGKIRIGIRRTEIGIEMVAIGIGTRIAGEEMIIAEIVGGMIGIEKDSGVGTRGMGKLSWIESESGDTGEGKMAGDMVVGGRNRTEIEQDGVTGTRKETGIVRERGREQEEGTATGAETKFGDLIPATTS